eukprot:8453137-Alexandrium_andersonii.AAC.1
MEVSNHLGDVTPVFPTQKASIVDHTHAARRSRVAYGVDLTSTSTNCNCMLLLAARASDLRNSRSCYGLLCGRLQCGCCAL